MATNLKPGTRLYDDDFYEWALAQARLLRERRFEELDFDNLIEEVDGLARRDLHSVRSRVRTIVELLLKLEHSPAGEPREGWHDIIAVQRDDLSDELSPSLHRLLEQDLEALYERARGRAARALRRHGEVAAADALPETCPYGLEQITGDWPP